MGEFMDEITNVEIARADLNKFIKDPEVIKIMKSLDVEADDHDKIGDILDANHSGSITVIDFVTGLQRLRGHKLKRSDVVCLDLMVRSLQGQIGQLSSELWKLSNLPAQIQKLVPPEPVLSLSAGKAPVYGELPN